MEKSNKTGTEGNKKRARSPRQYPSQQVSAEQKAQAILAVWTERAKPVDVCRQLGVNWITFQQWQDRAMEGMLQALESRVNLAAGQVLSPRLQALISKRRMALGSSKLEARLAKLAASPMASAQEQEVMA